MQEETPAPRPGAASAMLGEAAPVRALPSTHRNVAPRTRRTPPAATDWHARRI